MTLALVSFAIAGVLAVGQASPAATDADSKKSTEKVTIELQQPPATAGDAPPRFTVRMTTEELQDLLSSNRLPSLLRSQHQIDAASEALKHINMGLLIDEMSPVLLEKYHDRFLGPSDLIHVPFPSDQRVTIEAPDLSPDTFRGPTTEVTGLMLHGVTEEEFAVFGIRMIQTARTLIDSGNPIYDRTTPQYVRHMAERELSALRQAKSDAAATVSEEIAIRAEIAAALGIDPDKPDSSQEAGAWLKESRRFSYIIKGGEFISRLKPLVDEINRKMLIAGFQPASALDRPGIYLDPEIGDVEIVLPKPMLSTFLEQADQFERRMAEDAIISIEAVRLTDRDIVTGVLASRINVQVQGVHDVQRFNNRSILRELGLNSLLAVANQQLQARTLGAVANGALPAGVQPVVIQPPTLPPIRVGTQSTTVGSTFSVGADDVFFDGRQQTTGFSYVGPDGLAHQLSFEVADSLRDLWERIERNLIVHKIKKTQEPTEFSVPIGPNTKTYKGIAALISQQNQQLVVATGTGAISEISATAGTWLVIDNFEITPIPGSSTTLTEEDRQEIETRILLTMFLRDPYLERDVKRELLASTDRNDLGNRLRELMREYGVRNTFPGRGSRSYREIFDERFKQAIIEERAAKKERNSTITLTFYSSQGSIVQAPNSTQLGDANDLTSFTTELTPNVVTPISSFFTKSGSGLTGTSPLSGIDRGERTDEERTMTHLIIRSRFPTKTREQADRDEGRFTGYFDLPIGREPNNQVDLPFLSSSDHPLERLAKLRVGLMFEVLDQSRILKPFAQYNPNRFPGDVPIDVYETATTRLMMIQKILSDSPGASTKILNDYPARFVVEVRSLLEFDEDFFPAPNYALRNMTQWNNADHIVSALHNSPGRFALQRLVEMLDDLGERLVPQDYIDNYMAYSPPVGLFGDRKLYPLQEDQVRALRRDVAAHHLRLQETYGDAFLEAVSIILKLGTYRSRNEGDLTAAPLRGCRDLVLFDNSGSRQSAPELYELAHEQFLLLRSGGYRGKLFEPSLVSLEHLPDDQRRLIYRGRDILSLLRQSEQYEP